MPKADIQAEEEFDTLVQPHIATKEMCFMRLQALYQISKNVSDKPELIGEFNARFSELHSWREKFEKSIQNITILKRKYFHDYVPSYKEIESFDEIYYFIVRVSSGVNIDMKQNRSEQKSEGSCVKPRLPKLELFPFDSKLENWPTFRDTFSSLIHTNKQIADIEKFYYLLSAVSGSALTIVKSMPVTSSNYQIVWDALVKRYENKRALATTYLDKLFNFSPLVNESVSGLNEFLQTFQENIKALHLLDIKDLSGFLLFYVALRNLDPVTRRELERELGQDELPTYLKLITFIEKHVRVLEMSECTTNSTAKSVASTRGQSKVNHPSGSKSNNFNSQRPTLSAAVANTDEPVKSNKSMECLYCKKMHSIYRCIDYTDLTPAQRLDKIKQLKLCENCLREHSVDDCPSKVRCTICKKKHHHTLHIDSFANSSSSAIALTCSANLTVLLGTAVIHVADCWGQYQTVRAIIDSGAMSSYITQDCAKRLGLSRRKCNFEPIGLGGNPVRDFGLTTCKVKPRLCAGPIMSTDAVIVSNIAGNLPTMPLSDKTIVEFQHLMLADPTYYKPAPVDLLIAGDLFPYIYDGQKILPREHGLPVAMSSVFGYVILGQTELDHTAATLSSNDGPFCGFSMNLDNIMHSFWEVENVPAEVTRRSPDDELAECLFEKEHRRDPTGRYVVKYPLRPSVELGDSSQMATRRLLNLESKLEREPELKIQYHKFMHEYEDLGHMNCLGDVQNVESKYIIPHFCIIKPTSTTTSHRVVFDASGKTSNNVSLNSLVLPGPKLQADINQLLINFRLHEICLSADICKMFRMIDLDQTQRPYQHILWRYSLEQPIQVFELNTLTYGVASCPYLAIKVLHTLADDEADKFPKAAPLLKTAFFMDDLLWSVATVEEALELQKELMDLLKTGGFILRKWSSNCPQVVEHLDEAHRETPVAFDDEANLSIKVLGLQWLPSFDAFSFSTTPSSSVITKRTVLSQIGRQFDPLGFVAPCMFYAKCFMQELWARQLDWDQSLPLDLQAQWQLYVKELPLLSNFKHERHVKVVHHTYCQILGFCDASTLGYAAAVYLRTKNANGDTKVSLVIAKSKVAPLKTVTIPRLELMAAHLLAKLIKYVQSILRNRLEINETLLFTDSSVVLAWLNTPSYTLKTFVSTRVSKINDSVPSECWYHVSGESNPADICSRGALPSVLLATHEWLNGPDWLNLEPVQWPIKTMSEFRDCNPPELKCPKTVLVSTETTDDSLYNLTEKYSSFTKLLNIVARCYQFIHNCRSTVQNRRSLSVTDLRQAHDILVKSVQKHYFSNDIVTLSKDGHCSQSLRKLNPFIDSNCFLRVGGRLSQSDLTYEKKHPLLLPKKSNFTSILIDHFHKLHLHVGPRTLQSLINQKYWIISARSAIRSRTIKCMSCFRVSPTNRQPIMGELPKFRTQDIHVFHTVGVDIGGPFPTKESTRRNAHVSKSYLCVFVCCATRAVHLEVLSSLSTECFLACFDRFTARRGLCCSIVSDNGTNFVSAGKQLKEVTEFLNTDSGNLSRGFVSRGIQWRHNPPTGSNFGGLYESVIKSAKLHLKRAIGTRALSFEELGTVFCRTEAVLNSRPLCALSSDPNEFEVLTPSHFLIGRELLSVPEHDLTDLSGSRLNRWQLVQQMSQQFWKLWRQDYLHTLQQRQKWFTNCRNLNIGDLVLLNSDAPSLQWVLARVSKLHSGPDGVVRVISVRTANNHELTRPVSKVSPLPLDQDSE